MNAKRNIPVIFFHEGNQEYLKYAVLAAQKYNEKVVLLGDESNKYFSNIWYDTNLFDKEEYSIFEKYYKHMSSNTFKFEITAFKKYYMVKQYMELSGEKECMLLDSDILSYCNYSDLKFADKYKACVSTNANQENFNWTSSGHSSYWTKEYLDDFIDFCEETYKNNIPLLEQKYNYHISNKVKGGICDMTLLYLWAKDKPGVYNCAKEDNLGVFDHNINTSENYFQNEYKMNPILRIKDVKFKEGLPYFTKKSGEEVQAYTLHCQGSAKNIIKDYYEKDFKLLIVHRYQLLFKKFTDRYVYRRKRS